VIEAEGRAVPRWVMPVVACLAYSITSMAMTFSNKAIIKFYDFDYPLFLTVFQARHPSNDEH
jgi:uncharacterized protein YqhQ